MKSIGENHLNVPDTDSRYARRVPESLNSLGWDEHSISKMLNNQIKAGKIEMPPSRKGMTKLFKMCNLLVQPVKCIDCILFCRGPKLENSDPEEFDFDKLVQWFVLNIRNLRHISYKDIDPDWLEENMPGNDYNGVGYMNTPYKPDPE